MQYTTHFIIFGFAERNFTSVLPTRTKTSATSLGFTAVTSAKTTGIATASVLAIVY